MKVTRACPGQARVYIVDKCLYQVLGRVPESQIDQFDVQIFFDSFRRLNQ